MIRKFFRLKLLKRSTLQIVWKLRLCIKFFSDLLLKFALLILQSLWFWLFVDLRIFFIRCLLFSQRFATRCLVVLWRTILITTQFTNIIALDLGFNGFGTTIFLLHISLNLCFLIHGAIDFLYLGQTRHLMIRNTAILSRLLALLTSILSKSFLRLLPFLLFLSFVCHLSHFKLL